MAGKVTVIATSTNAFYHDTAVQKQIYTIILLITCIVFISAGIFHAVENGERELDFGDALYYIVVTIATIGYGDITPRTAGGKVVAVTVILISFTVIPRELARLNQLIAMQSQFRKTYQPAIGNPHILVVGHVTDPRCLLNFFREFYHPDRIFSDESGVRSPRQSPCVIVGPEEPSEEVINLLDHPVLQHRVAYIKGSVMSEEDLCRVGADTARACFILVSKQASDRQEADAETIVRLLAIRNYNPDLEIFSQIVSPTYLNYISDASPDHLLCLKQFKLALMAKSCLYPGLIPLISNMCRSSAVAKRDQIAGGWQQEYIEGMSLEIYATTLPQEFYGLTFSQAAELLYKCSQGDVILLGVYEGTIPKSANASRSSEKPPSPSRLPRLSILPKLPLKPEPRLPIYTDNIFVDRMLSNPGDTLIIGEWHVVYVLSDNKKLTLESTISRRLKDWVNGGNFLPTPKPVQNSTNTGAADASDHESDHDESELNESAIEGRDKYSDSSHTTEKLVDSENLERLDPNVASETDSLLLPDKASTPSIPRQVVIDTAKYPESQIELRDHVLVVSDLDVTSLMTFVTMLRLKHHMTSVQNSQATPIIQSGRRRHWPILFLSWSTSANSTTLTQALQGFEDVFIMLASSDSKSELLRANLLRARQCVLLADNSTIQNVDGGVVDSHIILHYLAVLAIQAEATGVAPTLGSASPAASRSSSFSAHLPSTPPFLSTQSSFNWVGTKLPRGTSIRPIVELSIPRTMSILDTELRKRVLVAIPSRVGLLQRRQSPSLDVKLVRATSFGYNQAMPPQSPQYHRQQSKDNVKKPGLTRRQTNLMRQSIQDIDNTIRSRKLAQIRMSTIRKEQESSQKRYFDYRGPTALPFYAAGYGFADDVFDNMLCQSYFTPGLVRFMRELLFSENGRTSSDHHCKQVDAQSIPIVSSLIQVPVPQGFVSRTFGELFVDLAANGNIIAIGLYRKAATGSNLPYVAAGPKKSTVLMNDDLVFALAPPGAWKRYLIDLTSKLTPAYKKLFSYRQHQDGSDAMVDQVVDHVVNLQLDQ